MAFFVGLVIGIPVGLAFIVFFVRSESARSRLRTELATTIAAFARMTVDDSRKMIPPQCYPSWVVFSELQKLTWLNLQLAKVWPYVNEAASGLIKTTLEPILEEYRPSMFSSLKYSKFTLGTVAPQFTGISVVDDEGSGITLELEVNWDGDPSIIFDIKTGLGVSLPVQVKDIGFTGIFRLSFKPLIDEFPCFGAICYSLRQKKKLDFTLKVVGGDISSIPGIYDVIEETIRDAVEDSVAWPVHKIIPILPGDYSELELKPVGLLEVRLVRGKQLANKDLIGRSDPYAVLYVRPLRSRTKVSKTINNDLNPIWNEHFSFVVEDVATQHLVVKVFDDDGLQASELIGCARVQLSGLQPGKVKDVWLKLVKDVELCRDNKHRGQVHMELLYFSFGMENDFASSTDPDIFMTLLETVLKGINGADIIESEKMITEKRRSVIVRGVLSVTVISASNLPTVDFMGSADPFVVIKMKKTQMVQHTRVAEDHSSPTWNQTFDFLVEDGFHDMLILEIKDHDAFGKESMGSCIITLTEVIQKGTYDGWIQLDQSKSAKLHIKLKWASQSIYRPRKVDSQSTCRPRKVDSQ